MLQISAVMIVLLAVVWIQQIFCRNVQASFGEGLARKHLEKEFGIKAEETSVSELYHVT